MRNFRTPLLLLLVLLVLIVLLAPRLGLTRSRQQPFALPVDLKELIPASWTPLQDQFYHCDFDGDGEREWLVLYRYDLTHVTAASSAPQNATPTDRTLIGGVIYNPQVNRVPQEPGNENPYRPAYMFPYKLLPDIYPGKGQGYLGETSVTASFYPALTPADNCRVDEIAIWGYSDSPFPTRLSLFRWDNTTQSYADRHFVGNARVQTPPVTDAAQPINDVTEYNRLNDRSQLCEIRHYTRQDPLQALQFGEDGDQFTIDFCFNTPADPAYPEGVVVAALRGSNPPGSTLTGDSFLTGDAVVAPELASLKNATRQPYRVLVLENPGALPSYPGTGTSLQDSSNVTWLLGSEQITITTSIVMSDTTRRVAWQVASLANESVAADVHWRIKRVDLK